MLTSGRLCLPAVLAALLLTGVVLADGSAADADIVTESAEDLSVIPAAAPGVVATVAAEVAWDAADNAKLTAGKSLQDIADTLVDTRGPWNGAVAQWPYRLQDQLAQQHSFDLRASKQFGQCIRLPSPSPDGCGRWASALSSMHSARLCIKSDKLWRPQLSPSYLGECVRGAGVTCQAGTKPAAMVFLRDHGVASQECFDTATDHGRVCDQCLTDPDAEFLLHRASYIGMHAAVDNSVRVELRKFGPVLASIDVYSDMLYYQAGVYTSPAPSAVRLGHADVVIVGWGTSDDDAKQAYWIISNPFFAPADAFGKLQGYMHVAAGSADVLGVVKDVWSLENQVLRPRGVDLEATPYPVMPEWIE